MSRLLSRALTGASILALVVAAPASALAATHGHAPAAKPKPGHSAKPHAVKFALVGVFVSTTADTSTVTTAPTITVKVKTGRDHKHLRDTNVVVTVPSSAKVVRNGARAALTALQPGDHVVVLGTMVGDVRTASHVNAAGRPPISVTPPDTATVTTTDD